MESLFRRQQEIIAQFERIYINFTKDSASRKTQEYKTKRIGALDELWSEFMQNDDCLQKIEEKDHEYFTIEIFARTRDYYEKTRHAILSFLLEPDVSVSSKPEVAAASQAVTPSSSEQQFGAKNITNVSFSIPKMPVEKTNEKDKLIMELLNQQNTNFRAFDRLLRRVNVEFIEDKWELEDEIKSLQNRWRVIDELHLRIDSILQDHEHLYYAEFCRYEEKFHEEKRRMHKKLYSAAHLQQSTPTIEIPTFYGKYTQWPTFCDLFSEAIHNNTFLSKAQKMQHLKGKVKGEAERLIQHLNISTDNYEAAWDILTHRYDNPHVLFTQQIEIFLNQPSINKQTSFELKRLYDTTMECIHAVDNLGVETSTWDPLLVHLIAKKLDSQTYKEYKESRKNPRTLASLSELMNFIEKKFIALEPINKKENYQSPIKQTYQSVPKAPTFNTKPTFNKSQNNYHSKYQNKGHQHQVNSVQLRKCTLCKNDHDLFQCSTFLAMSSEDKIKTIAQLKVCRNCLYRHYDNKCMSNKRCKECFADHNTIIHEAMIHCKPPHTTLVPTPSTSSSMPTKPTDKNYNVNHVAKNDEEILLTTIQLKVKSLDGTFITLRALLDQGSQISLITENAAQSLNLKRQKYQASVAGVGLGSNHSKGMVKLDCNSIYGDHKFSTEALVVSRMINNLPNISFSKQSWPHLQHLQLADPEYNISSPIDLLLDASVYSEIIMSGLIKGPAQAPIAQQTKLGWILSGNVRTFNCHVVINNLKDIAQYWEMEDIQDEQSVLSKEEEYCEQLYQSTTKRLSDGKYEVALPMKMDFEKNLGLSKNKAVAQFLQLERKMKNNQWLHEKYTQFINEYIDLGHMRPINITVGPNFYLPHHGVIKLDSSTTALRVVFNGSSSTSSGSSLNDLMEAGPNLQHDLQTLILKWRKYKYVITADIEKMFRQIWVRKEDQPLQSIVWRNSPSEPIKEYQLTTVTYGTKAAPYLAIRTLRQIAKDNINKYSLAAAALQTAFYMDDLLAGGDTIQQTKSLQQQLIQVLKESGMNLRKWSSNEPKLIKDLPVAQLHLPYEFIHAESRKTLGLRWSSESDSFSFKNVLSCIEIKKYTKRQLLSDISKIYDPLGWLSPISIRAKLLFQKTWESNLSWDDELPKEFINVWLQIKNDYNNIENISIPRYLGNINKVSFQLHGFCDASEKAYACAIYIVTTDCKGESTSRLVAAKTKLSPLRKKVSLPKLELAGAQLLTELLRKVMLSLSLTDHSKLHMWTDSMVVLGWIHGDVSRWKPYVANRVCQITNIIAASHWRHVKSADNAADCATRGLSDISNHSIWWKGPEWLLTFDPQNISPQKYMNPEIEIKRSNVTAALQSYQPIILKLLNANSSITVVIRIVAWVLRYITITCLQNKEVRGRVLTTHELQISYDSIIKTMQAIEFKIDIEDLLKRGHVSNNSKLAGLSPFLDKKGLLRVGGRLTNANISYDAKHPIILSSYSRLTELIISQAHITTLHGGPRLTLSYIRDKFWIISGIRTVKKQLRMCVTCRRHDQAMKNHIMADLPSPRVQPSRPFSNVGVDFTGHVEIKANQGRGIKTTKGYVAVFVCLSTKSVHLELVSNLSTQSFLAAFRRFCSRRGTPANLYSDNGTNFLGASRLLKKEYKEIISTIDTEFISNISELGVQWHFNAPAWPSAGGLWEAAVKSFKYHLKRTLGEQKLTYEEFCTLLFQIEACLNSRPLIALTENPDDYHLTPGHFLIGGPLLSRPQTEPESKSLSFRWQLIQSINKQFWKRWSSEYLQQLQSRSKWRTPSKNLLVDDVVLIKEENLPPGRWALARVHELHPGNDGCVRVVSLKTQNNIIKRPINKLVYLPVTESEPLQNQPSNASNEQQTLSRTRRRPVFTFKNMFVAFLLLFTTIISPSIQHESEGFNISSLSKHQGLFFDKISDMRLERDQWKLIVYYDLEPYWKGFDLMKKYKTHLDELCMKINDKIQCDVITSQINHNQLELEHYNDVLERQQRSNHISRMRRGLINGVGYVANSLFGILDEHFAEQYEKDITIIRENEKHLVNLWKNQTTIVEAEYNELKRLSNDMEKQHKTFNQHLIQLERATNLIRVELTKGESINEFISMSIIANTLYTNLKEVQNMFIDTISDIYHGKFNVHLISPDQLKEQMNIISGQLTKDLSLPIININTDLLKLYHLLNVKARLTDNYLLFEVRIPLVSRENYEIYQVFTVPQEINQTMINITPISNYISINMHKNTYLPMSASEVTACDQYDMITLICKVKSPIYDFVSEQNLCLRNQETNECYYESKPCMNKWEQLSKLNTYLAFCCNVCVLRFMCGFHITKKEISKANVITLSEECVLRADTFSVFAHKQQHSNVYVKGDFIEADIHPINNIINLTIPNTTQIKFQDHESSLLSLREQIDQMKSEEADTDRITYHDVHHYTAVYVLLGGSIVYIIVQRCWRARQSRGSGGGASSGVGGGARGLQAAAPACPGVNPSSTLESSYISYDSDNGVSASAGLSGTSPVESSSASGLEQCYHKENESKCSVVHIKARSPKTVKFRVPIIDPTDNWI